MDNTEDFFNNYRGKYSQYWIERWGLIPELPTSFDNANSVYELMAWLHRAFKNLLDDFQQLEAESEDFNNAIIDLLEYLIPELIRRYHDSAEFRALFIILLEDILAGEERTWVKDLLKELLEVDMREWIEVYLKELYGGELKKFTIEVTNARGNYHELGRRLDEVDNKQLETTAQLEENKNRIYEVASTGTTTSVIQNKISEMAQNGTILFNTVSNEMTTFMKKNNLFNPDIALVDKIPKWVGYNPDLTSDTNVTSTPNYITSNVIQCNEGEVYIYEGNHLASNIYYADSTKTLKQAIEVDNKTPFTIPRGIKYFRVLFTYNGPDYNNNQWREKIKIVKGNSLENISPYGKNEVKDLILPNEIVKEHNLSQALKDKINGINTENSTLLIPKGTYYSEDEAILLLNFDGWNQNTFNVIAPYLKEKGISFTLFFTGYDKGTGINPNDLRNYAKEMGKKFEMGMYTGQPSSTMSGTTNFKEQMAQIKASYDGIVNYGLPKPRTCSYAGGIKSELTEYLCQNVFSQKIGRTTENSNIVNPVTTTFSIPCSGYGDDGTYTISVVDSIVTNKQQRAAMTHNILNGTDVTDTSYNMRESYLKAWIDKIALEVSNERLKCMTFYEYYLYTILPHTSSIGQHALVWENDNRQHEYIYTENGWVELTNFQSYK